MHITALWSLPLKSFSRGDIKLEPLFPCRTKCLGADSASVDMEMEAVKVVVEINLNFHGDIDILGAISVKN